MITTIHQFILEAKKKSDKNSDLMIVDVQENFSKFFSEKYVEELQKYCKDFARVYQIWDNMELDKPTYEFPNEVNAYEKQYGFDLQPEDAHDYFMPAIAEKIVNGQYTQGDGFEMKDGRIAIYVGAQHDWFLVEDNLVSLFNTLKSQGRKLILVGGADNECLEDIYQTALYFDLEVELNYDYIYSYNGSPFSN